ELLKRAEEFSYAMEKVWDNNFGAYLNYRTDVDSLSKRVSPTMFYPLLAELGYKGRAGLIVKHFYDPNEFYGDWMLPSTTRNDPLFPKQRYWKGAIWPPLNFLTYLSLRQAGFYSAASELSNKSLKLIMTEWNRKGYVSENYSSITGTGDDKRLSSDRFHSWGALFGIMSFMENGYLERFEKQIK
ncbi:MAG TPA: trehalase family glycosidase, partial [Candidatus Marinimicrobia bacterium]|nr:trehalase family glycosidase [Candidatus Neomarinimicrobiota bacterium]